MKGASSNNDKGEPSLSAVLLVWDTPTRIFHWLLVATAAVVTGFVLPQWWLGAPRAAGYAIIGLLVFRLFCAGFGSEYSRLTIFTHSPSDTLGHLRGTTSLR